LVLLERFRTTKAILGVIGIARTRIEPVDEISARLAQALEHIDAERLIAGPDCGLIMLDRPTAMAKLKNLVAAAKFLD
jgi:5-methyltetrahydropteroyltriglutamate--homocysteine methyltransferase